MSDDHSQDPLEVYWDDVRVARARAAPSEPSTLSTDPGDLVIGTSRDRILVTIKPNGQLEFGPEYTPDEAAVIFWEAMGRRRLQMEDRILVIQHMEAILTRIGEADMRCEDLRRRSAEGDAEAGQAAGHAMLRLERLVHQAIELGRGLARRPELVPPAVPERVPRSIQEAEQSAYEGRQGLAEEDQGEVEQRPTMPEAPQSFRGIHTANPPAPVMPGGETANPPSVFGDDE